MVKQANRPGDVMQNTNPTPPDRKITEPSFQFPPDMLQYHYDQDIERISVQTVSDIKKHTPAPPSPTGYSVINPDTKPEIDAKNLVNSSHKFHKLLHKGLSNLNAQEKMEAREILRDLLKFLEI